MRDCRFGVSPVNYPDPDSEDLRSDVIRMTENISKPVKYAEKVTSLQDVCRSQHQPSSHQ